jgi:membrane protein YdbS with pleckstrin-like domain
MDIRKLVRNIKDEEEVVGVFHQFWISLFWHWIGGLLILLAPFFFLYLFLRWGTIGSAILVILFLIGFFWLLRTWRVWKYTMLVLTDERLIVVNQVGFFDRSVSQVDLGKINDVSYRKKGFLQTIFRFGSIAIQASGLEKIVLNNLSNPSFIQQEIFNLKNKFDNREIVEYSESDLLAIMREIRSRVGENRWKTILEGDWELKQELIDEFKDEEDSEKANAIEQFFSREI